MPTAAPTLSSLKPKTYRQSSSKRGYGHSWRIRSKRFLRKHPLCEMECKDKGRVTPATLVDHIVPHKGDPVLFNDEDNWQAGCEECHNRKTATKDGGFGRRQV